MKIKIPFLICVMLTTWQAALSQDMYPVWAKNIAGPGWDIARTICVNHEGDLLVTGAFSDTITISDEKFIPKGETDVYAAKYSADGEYLGAIIIGGEGIEYPMFSVYDSYDVLMIKYYRPFTLQGTLIDSLDKINYAIIWFNPEGQILCHRVIASKKKIKITDMETDKQGTIYFTGWFTNTLHYGDKTINDTPGENTFVATCKNMGEQISVSSWKKKQAGRIYACYPTHGDRLTILGIQYDSIDSNVKYLYYAQTNNSKHAQANNSKLEITDTLAVGPEIEPESIIETDNNTWLTARYKYYYYIGEDTITALGQNDVLLAKISKKNGEPQVWRIGGYANDLPLSLSASGRQVVLAGTYADTIWFAENNYMISDKWGSDLFVAVYANDSISPVKTVSLGGISNDFPCAVATFDAGVYALGQFKKTLELGDTKFETQGSYDVFVARFENCDAKEAMDVTVSDNTDNNGQITYTLTAGEGYYNYEWGNNKGYGQSVNTTQKGKYTVTATDEYGCTCKGEIDISVKTKSISLIDIESDDNDNDLIAFSLYPTITSNYIYWQPGSSFPTDGATLNIYDVAGRTVFTKEYNNYLQPDSKQTLNLSGLISGQYIVEINGADYNESVKVIVK